MVSSPYEFISKMTTIPQRIALIVEYKAKKKKDFAEIMGWKPNYLSKLISGEQGVGLTPISQILKKFPDIDARWLLFGDGDMTTIKRKRRIP